MMTDIHEPWIHQLSDFLDGDLDAESRRGVEGHLAACPSCRQVLEELRHVVARARGLGGEEPPRDLWPEIAAAIAAPGPQAVETPREADVIPLPTATRDGTGPAGLFLTVRQLAAASIVLAVVSAAVTWWVGPGVAATGTPTATPLPPPSFVAPAADVAGPPAELAQELDELERVLAESRGRLDPNTLRILEKNLGVIQRAIDESLQALAVDPENGYLRRHLDETYREKAGYLREAATIIAWSGEA